MSTKNRVYAEIKKFEFIAKYIWPRVRIFFKHYITPRCSRCVISAKVPGITLVGGLCDKCRAYVVGQTGAQDIGLEPYDIEKQRRDLDELLRSYQGKGKGRFDALLVFSGGKDSTYILYKIKTEYPDLRLLTTTWDNGFYSPVALDNAKEVAKKLDVEHILYKPKSSLYKNMYRYTLTHVHEGGCYGTVDNLDGSLNQHIGMTLAATLEIPLFITGVERAQALIMSGYKHFEMPREHAESRWDRERVERMSRIRLADVFSEEDLNLWWDGTKWPKERIPRVIYPFIAWRPNTKFIIEELARLNLLMPEHTSPLMTNNEVLAAMAAVDIKKIGYCSFEPEFSDMVRHEQADPLFWRNVFELLEYLVKTNKFLNKSYLGTLQRLDLTAEEVGLV